MIQVRNAGRCAADICRDNGWKAGTRLTGTEYYSGGKSHTDTIRITAVGEHEILAVCEACDGVEGTWTLNFRDWALAV